MLTGEPLPQEKRPGDTLTGGTVNGLAPLVLQVAHTGAETVLSQIMDLVDAAQKEKSKAQRLADRISSVFVPVILAISAITFAGWLLAGAGVVTALITAVAVLVVACPCALGLATPVAIMAETGRGAQLGLLIRGGESLERVHGLATVVLDKTGTLTTGHPEVVPLLPGRQRRARRAGPGGGRRGSFGAPTGPGRARGGQGEAPGPGSRQRCRGGARAWRDRHRGRPAGASGVAGLARTDRSGHLRR
jgi:P-type E1-E2 ATPase